MVQVSDVLSAFLFPFLGCSKSYTCKIREETQQESGLKSSITEVCSTVSNELWRQKGCYVIWNVQRQSFSTNALPHGESYFERGECLMGNLTFTEFCLTH